MTQPPAEVVSACETLCTTFFGLAATPDDPAAIAAADESLHSLDRLLAGAS